MYIYKEKINLSGLAELKPAIFSVSLPIANPITACYLLTFD
jgi:hypothetical protein